jgi:hypothetical protein
MNGFCGRRHRAGQSLHYLDESAWASSDRLESEIPPRQSGHSGCLQAVRSYKSACLGFCLPGRGRWFDRNWAAERVAARSDLHRAAIARMRKPFGVRGGVTQTKSFRRAGGVPRDA